MPSSTVLARIIGTGLAAFLLVSCGTGDPVTSVAPWEPPIVVGDDDRTLTLNYLASSCGEFHHVDVHEQPSRIALFVYEKTTGSGTCTADALVHAVTIRLESEVDGRDFTGCGLPDVEPCPEAPDDVYRADVVQAP
jgi:hypothetical protein